MARSTSKTAPEISSYPVYTKKDVGFSPVIFYFFTDMVNADIHLRKVTKVMYISEDFF
jgi:hypothetical protein